MSNSTIPPWTIKLADRSAKALMIGAAIIGGGALVGSGVFASLNATANNVGAEQDINTQTLILTQTAAGASGGITTDILDLAPGDVVNRFVDLANAGTMAGTNLNLRLGASPSTALTTDATNGLQVTIFECETAWASDGTCSGGAGTRVMDPTAASSLTTTAQAVSVGSLAAATTSRLKIEIKLPAGNETTVNGVLPTGTVQGLASSLTWTFTEDQRTATTSQQ